MLEGEKFSSLASALTDFVCDEENVVLLAKVVYSCEYVRNGGLGQTSPKA